jgi:hypothetical protein
MSQRQVPGSRCSFDKLAQSIAVRSETYPFKTESRHAWHDEPWIEQNRIKCCGIKPSDIAVHPVVPFANGVTDQTTIAHAAQSCEQTK